MKFLPKVQPLEAYIFSDLLFYPEITLPSIITFLEIPFLNSYGMLSIFFFSYIPVLAVARTLVDRSVARILICHFSLLWRTSLTAIAILYASSPEEHPALQNLKQLFREGAFIFTISGKAFALKKSKCCNSRKKYVRLVEIESRSSINSFPLLSFTT